jgi:rubrerythrin
VTIFLEDYIGLCSIRIEGQTDACTRLAEYLKSLPPKAEKREKETTIREREIVMMPCPYCKTLVSITEGKCPNCGAYIKG